MSELTINEAYELRNKLEVEILNLLIDFQKKTNLRITGLEYNPELINFNDQYNYIQFSDHKAFAIEITL